MAVDNGRQKVERWTTERQLVDRRRLDLETYGLQLHHSSRSFTMPERSKFEKNILMML